MTVKFALQAVNLAIIVGCFLALYFMVRRQTVRQYPFLFALLVVRCTMTCITVALLFHRAELGLSKQMAYDTYYYSHWAAAIAQIFLQVLMIYGVFRIAMKPLDGLKRVGTLIFRWVASVSFLLSAMVALGPHVPGMNYQATLVGQAQEGVSVLTLCLLLFVCFAIKPLGLTYRSRVFGIALGLGISSSVSFFQSSWFSTQDAMNLYSPVYLVGGIGSLLGVMCWATYVCLPEPKRVMVLLPTTSPYFLWNSISEALGSSPGMVAVAGFTPAMLAPAEVTAMTAASRFAKEFANAEVDSLRSRQQLVASL